ncbi:hypothetical protein ACOME3_007820 [Neoechinorhynchus agilis]
MKPTSGGDIELPNELSNKDVEYKRFLVDLHVSFLTGYGIRHSIHASAMSDYLLVSGLYWSTVALSLVGHLDHKRCRDTIQFVHSCYDEDKGAFKPCPSGDYDVHLLFTLSAIQTLMMLETDNKWKIKYQEPVVRFVCSLQQADGSFAGDRWGEIDTRFSFCAAASLALLNQLNSRDFVMSCQNFDGGFGCRPGAESHAGQIYCCVGFLSVMNELGRMNEDATEKLAWWLCERQLSGSGGLNGRPQKMPDVCYSWWVLASLKILGREHWIDMRKLSRFIFACQDTEKGGFSDRPGDEPDPFHTLFGIAGLSIIGHEHSGGVMEQSIETVNPVFCMPQKVLDKHSIHSQIL